MEKIKQMRDKKKRRKEQKRMEIREIIDGSMNVERQNKVFIYISVMPGDPNQAGPLYPSTISTHIEKQFLFQRA